MTSISSRVARTLHTTESKYQEACPGSQARHAGSVIRFSIAGIALPVAPRAGPGSSVYLFVLSSVQCVHVNRAPAVHRESAAPGAHLDDGARAALQARCAGRLVDPRGEPFGWKSGTTGGLSVEIQPRFTAHDAPASCGHNGGGTQI